MPRKKKRSIIDELFGSSIFNEKEFVPDDLSGTGYSISVSQTPEGTKVKAKVGKDTNVDAFRRQLQQKYPNATVEIEGGTKKTLIQEISTKTLKKESGEDNETEG